MSKREGTRADELILGADRRDQLYGRGGDDTLVGFGGDDTLRGGDGADRLRGDGDLGPFGRDRLAGGEGDDVFEFRLGASASTFSSQDVVVDFEGAGVDGGDAIDLRLGLFEDGQVAFRGEFAGAAEIGADMGRAGDGRIELRYAFQGGATVAFADSNDNGALDGEDFAVRLSGTHALARDDFDGIRYRAEGTREDDLVRGTELGDRLLGRGGDDTLVGFGGDDSLRGGDGADRLRGDGDYGPFGRDVLTGGEGEDVFEWRLGVSASTFSDQDVVLDFEGAGVDGGDVLDLLPEVFGNGRLAFGGEFEGPAEIGVDLGQAGDRRLELRYAFEGGDTVVFADSNDNGRLDGEDFVARLSGTHALGRADFSGHFAASAEADGLFGA